MFSKQHHWLEIAEYLAVAMVLIGTIAAIAFGNLSIAIIFISLALALNLLNRFRWHHLNRKHLTKTVKQLQHQLSEEMQSLIVQQENNAPRPINADNLAELQQSLVSLERTVDNIARYLNSYSLPERIEQLEQSCDRIQQQIATLSPKTTERNEIVFTQTEPELKSPPPVLESPQALSDWNCLYSLDAHTETVASLAISSDSKFLASASWDRQLKLWELAAGKLLSPIAGHAQGILAVVFIDGETERDRYRLVTGSFDRTIKIWSFAPAEKGDRSFRLERTLNEHEGSVHALAFAPQHKILVSGSYDRSIMQWNLETGRILKSSYDRSGAVYAVAVNEAIRLIASAGGDGRISLWQLETGEELGWLRGNISSVESLAISPDGQILAAGCVDGRVKLWQLDPNSYGSPQPPQPIRVLNAHLGQVKSIAFSPDGENLLSCGADGTIKIWQSSSIEAIRAIAFADKAVSAIAIDPSSQFLAAGGTDGTIKIWQRL